MHISITCESPQIHFGIQGIIIVEHFPDLILHLQQMAIFQHAMRLLVMMMTQGRFLLLVK